MPNKSKLKKVTAYSTSKKVIDYTRECIFKNKICTCRRAFLEDGYHHINCPVLEYNSLIGINGAVYYLGAFRDKISAAIAYDLVALLVNGEFAQTNVLLNNRA